MIHIPHTAIRHRRRRGIVMGLAIAMLVFVAAAVTYLTVAFSYDARRTSLAQAAPQLRQLLLAGEVAASPAIPLGPQTVPTPIDGATLTLTALPAPDADDALVEVRAAYRKHTASQRLTYHRNGPTWTLTAAQLHDPT